MKHCISWMILDLVVVFGLKGHVSTPLKDELQNWTRCEFLEETMTQ